MHKFTYPGKTVDEIESDVQHIDGNLSPSHVILHCGTNNLPTDEPNVCMKKLENLCLIVQSKFPKAKIAVSTITCRKDIQLKNKIGETNNMIMDHYNINETCLNNSNLHLNAKGTALLAVGFIKFLRRKQPSDSSPQNFLNYHKQPAKHSNFRTEETLQQIGNMLRTALNKT